MRVARALPCTLMTANLSDLPPGGPSGPHGFLRPLARWARPVPPRRRPMADGARRPGHVPRTWKGAAGPRPAPGLRPLVSVPVAPRGGEAQCHIQVTYGPSGPACEWQAGVRRRGVRCASHDSRAPPSLGGSTFRVRAFPDSARCVGRAIWSRCRVTGPTPDGAELLGPGTGIPARPLPRALPPTPGRASRGGADRDHGHSMR
jgi:hypothetical protein